MNKDIYFFLIDAINLFGKQAWKLSNGVQLISVRYSILYFSEVKRTLYTRKLKYEHFTPAFWLHKNLKHKNTNSKGDFERSF